jgi:hypothetical protein
MATPKPGEIRCPTCHRSTPPAAFCTQCGSAIPTDARIRPRGMDRDELQERIRARRSGGEPYRRGAASDDEGAYERFEPEPEDARVQRGRRADSQRPDHLAEGAAAAGASAAAGTPEPARREDLTRDRDEWTAPVVPPPAEARATEPTPPEPTYAEPGPAEPEHIDAYEDGYADPYEEYPYDYDQYEEPERRSSGGGAFAILGFLALGVLALFGGAVLAGVCSGDDPGVGSATPTPSLVESLAPEVSDAPSLAPSIAPSAGESAPASSGEPVVFPDGFSAEAQPCLPGSAGGTGCNSNGAVNGGTVDIWVGFENGTAEDVIGATIVGPDGSTVAEGSIDLARINCGASCNGWTYFNFRNLTEGTYQVRVTRNGNPASETSFEVS